MTRPIICVILMVVFVLGMVAKETQGENTCHTNISYGNEGCESMVCSLDCATNWKGFGECSNHIIGIDRSISSSVAAPD
uniref:Defensin-like protein n=1 Tax=Brassica campestris TaxID=3711 RepID=M4EZN9_BRACM|nr:unnamed protein product [Brassica rapa]